MSDYRNNNDHQSHRDTDSSGWQSARSSGPRKWDNDRRGGEGRRWDNDRRDNRRGGEGRRWDNDRRDNRRDDRGPRKWDNDRRDNRRGGEGRRWDNDRRDNRRDDRGPRKWDNDRRDNRRGGEGRRWDNDRRDNRRGSEHTPEGNYNYEDARDLLAEIPESITAQSLDGDVRRRLMSLNKENGERVARHLAYAGEMMDIDPEVAYQHAYAAYQRAARVDVVREALGLTAYITGRYAEALRELRTYRRMSDDYSHIPIEADSERGLGRPEKALRFIEGVPLTRLDAEAKIELVIVISGARAETGDHEGGLAVLEKILVENLDSELAARVQLTKADRLEELGRTDEAEELRVEWQHLLEDDEDFSMMVDLDDVLDDLPEDDSADSADEAFDHTDTDLELDESEQMPSSEGLDSDEFEDEFGDDFIDDDIEDDIEGDIEDTDLEPDSEVDPEFEEAFDELFDEEDANE
ncbi:tetratricopeptide repeat protein [Arcanobacterium phocae]|uniref:tetratricopeptide repeat protein n=1 Tax=Arcanobacterium phocae TaxID=131112 RepID=UPI00209E7833|nr:hypothetical protein [Arcanobacterium phocae]